MLCQYVPSVGYHCCMVMNIFVYLFKILYLDINTVMLTDIHCYYFCIKFDSEVFTFIIIYLFSMANLL